MMLLVAFCFDLKIGVSMIAFLNIINTIAVLITFSSIILLVVMYSFLILIGKIDIVNNSIEKLPSVFNIICILFIPYIWVGYISFKWVRNDNYLNRK
jgi:hypothetical protein